VEHKQLTDLLWTHIEDDPKVCHVLYPGKGGNPSTVNGGGMKKIHVFYMLAEKLFKDHKDYKDLPAVKAAFDQRHPDHKNWKKTFSIKIKNRIDKLETQTKKQFKELSQTGQGIMSRDEIYLDTELDNIFSMKFMTSFGKGNTN
jgi:hypothetical protein